MFRDSRRLRISRKRFCCSGGMLKGSDDVSDINVRSGSAIGFLSITRIDDHVALAGSQLPHGCGFIWPTYFCTVFTKDSPVSRGCALPLRISARLIGEPYRARALPSSSVMEEPVMFIPAKTPRVRA